MRINSWLSLLDESRRLASLGRFESAERAASAAIRRGGGAEALKLRAQWRAAMRMDSAAFADYKRALSSAPDAQSLAACAALARSLEKSKEAAGLLRRALKLKPGNAASLRAELAEVLRKLGETAAAIWELEKAAAGAASDEDQARLQLRALKWRFSDGALRAGDARLKRLAETGPQTTRSAVLKLRGILRAAEGDMRGARKDFQDGARAGGPEAGACGRLDTVAEMLPAINLKNRPKRKKSGRLLIIGLGMRTPYSVSREALGLLREADVLFDNVADGETAEFLRLFGRPVHPLRGEGLAEPARIKLFSKRLFGEISQGRDAAFVTRGNAHVLGAFAAAFLRRCREQNIPCATVAAVSVLDLMFARHLETGASSTGRLQAFTGDGLAQAAKVDGKFPLALLPYADMKPPEVRAAAAKLMRAYGSEALVQVYGPRRAAPPWVLPLGQLARSFPTLHAFRDLFISGKSNDGNTEPDGDPLLTVCGLGAEPAKTATWETLDALRRADAVFAETPSSLKGSRRLDWAAAKRELANGRRVAVVLDRAPWHVPSSVANQLKKLGPARVLPSISPASFALAESGVGFGEDFDALIID